MTNEELERLRKKYNELKKKRIEVEQLGEAIKVYEQNPVVKKYLELVELYKNYTTGVMYGMDKMTNEELAVKALEDGLFIENTSNIYVYNGTYMNNTPIGNGKSISIISRKKLPYDSQLADYSEYKNIESKNHIVRVFISDKKEDIESKNHIARVSISDREKFEKENIVLFLPKEVSFEDIQGLYLEAAISEGLEEAKQYVLTKSINRKEI